ncbi:rRNA maturation RNase YbeY [Candidatus Falkowbacteria bacterium CG10_big_fil_rev_8_21_14_0_10_37_14]|uniref:Endoribonuclease YbeY n=1 Tax=Candidatus Falkowbacteria bacterium CG10_big_fil_rev_8_21_14_0_10_37_14 TaxID=1974561 RepID=A0A2M6WU15_9BACT|nr:rRNA maturation RNase YbeY [Candidatus Falkowbacteria bacterium]PIT96216.1 MAG: rRNA maturation RNase YbeY [Candidatus Falkowbacteria bacterium CG10_big_fil_rev_8_21_14_0_10_37_14]
MLVEVSNKTRSRIDTNLIRRVLEHLLKHYRLNKQGVSVALIGDKSMRQLNKKWRGKDKPTDILSFTADEPDYLGELIIDWQQIKRQAPRFRQSARRELIFIVVHGFLHLIGYLDDTDNQSKKMLELGTNLIDKLKLDTL